MNDTGTGRGRGATLPAWTQNAETSVTTQLAPPQAAASVYNREEEIDQIATQAVLEQQEAEMRATFAQQR